MPEDIGGSPAHTWRIGLGPLTARQARVEAELLAAHARIRFEQIRTARMQDDQSEGDDGDLLVAIGEVKGYLMAVRDQIERPSPPTPPHQEPAFAGIRGLVSLNRELAKGPEGNSLIVDNAELLKAQSIARVMETVEIVDGTKKMTPPLRQANPPAPEADPVARHVGALDGAKTSASALHLKGTSAFVPAAAAAQPEQASPGRIHRDDSGKIIPGFRLDRRSVTRKSSDLPRLSEVAEEYFAAREVKLGGGHKDIKTARMRLGVFLDLIGDHPVDTYTPADLQAFIALMTHWPAQERHRPSDKSPREILAANADLSFKPLKRSALEDGYVTTARSIIRYKMTDYEYPDPFLNAKLRYPETAAPKQSTEPLSSDQKTRIFRTGVEGGLLDEAVLPLLGDLTGRRLGLLVHLQGSDLREKYPGVFVAQTGGIVLTADGVWRRVPIKTDQSTTFFILHDFLREIGFVDWARAKGQTSLFPELTRLAEPSKSASSYMQRLFKKAGVQGQGREVFHSLRGGHIDFLRKAKVDARDRRLQAGHKIDNEHDLYGFKAITEDRAFEIAHAKLDQRVDYSMFRGLDFEKLAQGKRTRGRRVKG
ncbi:hypothetical protein JYU29_12510 [Tianweitania sp. BSSL-BM11]|uniref:Tyr recombinase domain-containing protein n=1 Tax=Tianweitania aestuarii TaxID=2814886 RepID=A0ABS5RWQ5_9HYPH|nr:hypothetical protein [Tianweitania aestuarii]MBS9721506.1 hypothetical protein [Tianweitania aestuarii]